MIIGECHTERLTKKQTFAPVCDWFVAPAVTNMSAWCRAWTHRARVGAFTKTRLPIWIAARDPNSHQFAVANNNHVQVMPLWIISPNALWWLQSVRLRA